MRYISAGAAFLALAVAACATAPRGAPPPGILLITADSLRADRIDWSGGRTPALAMLARRGTRFERAYTVTPWTAPSLVSIFTGLYPPTHGVENRDDATPKALPTLPRLLGARGYSLRNYGFFTEVSYFRNLGLPAQAVTGAEDAQNIYRQFTPGFFDLVVVDECHRGSAAEDSAWRDILTYFGAATQIGMTATPKETDEVSNIHYFQDPIFTYSLKQGIEDGFLAPYRVHRVVSEWDAAGWRPTQDMLDRFEPMRRCWP